MQFIQYLIFKLESVVFPIQDSAYCLELDGCQMTSTEVTLERVMFTLKRQSVMLYYVLKL